MSTLQPAGHEAVQQANAVRGRRKLRGDHRRGLGDHSRAPVGVAGGDPQRGDRRSGGNRGRRRLRPCCADADGTRPCSTCSSSRAPGSAVLKSLAHGTRPANTKIIVFTNYAFPQYRDRSLVARRRLLLRQGARVPPRARSAARAGGRSARDALGAKPSAPEPPRSPSQPSVPRPNARPRRALRKWCL